jgi:hypothetical protein
MKWFAYLFSGLCLVLAIQIGVSAWVTIKYTPKLETRDYITYVQMLITFITATGLAAFSFASARSNIKLQADLSKSVQSSVVQFQSELNLSTALSVEKIKSEFTTSVNESTERLRLELNKTSEEFKARLGQYIPQKYGGYHAMFKAATKCFLAVQRLEEGIYPDDALKSASDAVDDAIGSSLVVDTEDRRMFFDFVRETTFIADNAAKDREPAKLIKCWESEGKELGRKYNKLESAFGEKVRS